MEQFVNILDNAKEFLSGQNNLLIGLLLVLPFLALFLVLVPIFLIGGYKKGLYRSSVSLGCTAVSCVLSALLSKLLSTGIVLALSDNLTEYLGKMMDNLQVNFSKNLSEMLFTMEYLPALMRGMASALLSMLIFPLLFLILLIVFHLVFGKLLKPFLTKKGASMWFRQGGMLVGLLDAFFISFLLFAPLYSFVGCGTNVALGMIGGLSEVMESPEYTSSNAHERVDDAKETVVNALVSVKNCPMVWLAQQPVFDFGQSLFGTFHCDGYFFNVYDVLEDGADISIDIFSMSLKKPADYSDKETQTLRNVLKCGEKNKFFYGIVSDIVSVVCDMFQTEEKEETLSVGRVVKLLLEPYEGKNINDLEECSQSAVRIFDIAVRYGLFESSIRTGSFWDAMANGNCVSELTRSLRSSDILSRSLDNVLLYLLDALNFSGNPASNEKYEKCMAMVRDSISERMKEGSPDIETEVRALTYFMYGLRGTYNSSNGLKSFRLDTVDAEGLAGMLIGLGMHPYMGEENLRNMVNTILPMLDENEGNVFTELFLDNAVNSLLYDIQNPPQSGAVGRFSKLLSDAQRDSLPAE